MAIDSLIFCFLLDQIFELQRTISLKLHYFRFQIFDHFIFMLQYCFILQTFFFVGLFSNKVFFHLIVILTLAIVMSVILSLILWKLLILLVNIRLFSRSDVHILCWKISNDFRWRFPIYFSYVPTLTDNEVVDCFIISLPLLCTHWVCSILFLEIYLFQFAKLTYIF